MTWQHVVRAIQPLEEVVVPEGPCPHVGEGIQHLGGGHVGAQPPEDLINALPVDGAGGLLIELYEAAPQSGGARRQLCHRP